MSFKELTRKSGQQSLKTAKNYVKERYRRFCQGARYSWILITLCQGSYSCSLLTVVGRAATRNKAPYRSCVSGSWRVGWAHLLHCISTSLTYLLVALTFRLAAHSSFGFHTFSYHLLDHQRQIQSEKPEWKAHLHNRLWHWTWKLTG